MDPACAPWHRDLLPGILEQLALLPLLLPPPYNLQSGGGSQHMRAIHSLPDLPAYWKLTLAPDTLGCSSRPSPPDHASLPTLGRGAMMPRPCKQNVDQSETTPVSTRNWSQYDRAYLLLSLRPISLLPLRSITLLPRRRAPSMSPPWSLLSLSPLPII